MQTGQTEPPSQATCSFREIPEPGQLAISITEILTLIQDLSSQILPFSSLQLQLPFKPS